MLNRILNLPLFRRNKAAQSNQTDDDAQFQYRRVFSVNTERRIKGGGVLSGFSLREREAGVVPPYYASTKQVGDLVPSINPCSFDDFWEEIPSAPSERDTVDHKHMKVRDGRFEAKHLTGIWHVKTPGHESIPERFKRYMQKMIFRITGQKYKAEFYNNKQLLAQKEVMAANVYKAVVSKADDPQFQKEYQVYYSLNEKKNDHCIAGRHLENHNSGSKLVGETRHKESPVYFRKFHPVHNPATDLVVRRFLLGDEDYLKLDNYMFSEDPEKSGRQRLLNIDFGMAFYNQCRLPDMCNFEQFQQKILSPSAKHRLQYFGKHTINSVIAAMDPRDVRAGMRTALKMIADLTDEEIDLQTRHIHQPDVREAMALILKHKRNQAAAVMYSGQHPWPEELGRSVIDSLVGQSRRT